jgi:hypothetical protein
MNKFYLQSLWGNQWETTSKHSTKKSLEKSLLQMDWIEPHVGWRGVEVITGKKARIGTPLWNKEKGKVFWKLES